MRPLSWTTIGATALLAAATAPAATVTITDCGAPPVQKVGTRTVIARPADDVVIACALLPLAGTSRIEVTARSIVVDDEEGGSIVAAGKDLAIALMAAGTDADDQSVVLRKTSRLETASPVDSPCEVAPTWPCAW